MLSDEALYGVLSKNGGEAHVSIRGKKLAFRFKSAKELAEQNKLKQKNGQKAKGEKANKPAMADA